MEEEPSKIYLTQRQIDKNIYEKMKRKLNMSFGLHSRYGFGMAFYNFAFFKEETDGMNKRNIKKIVESILSKVVKGRPVDCSISYIGNKREDMERFYEFVESSQEEKERVASIVKETFGLKCQINVI